MSRRTGTYLRLFLVAGTDLPGIDSRPVLSYNQEGAGRKGEKLVVQPRVLCELAWVLESAYGVSLMNIRID